jgi:DNA adenine methylase
VTTNASPIAWYGGKALLSRRIVELLPRHHTYVEAFGGGGSVLFRKPPARLEVYNDLDEGLVTFFRVLRERPEALARALTLTPYARSEFESCRDSWEQCEDELERARRWYVRSRQSFGCSDSVGWGFEVDGAQRGGTRAGSFATAIDNLRRYAERFRRVQVERLDWRDCLSRYDSADTCFYLDPPYHPETRGIDRSNAYRHDLTGADHQELVERVASLVGSVLISGYAHPLYAELEGGGFERFEFPHNTTASRVLHGRGPRIEIVWRRSAPELHDLSLWTAEGVA